MERQSKRLYLFNCDNTCKLEPVETLLLQMEEKHDLKIVVEKLYFGLQRMSEICETTIPQLEMDYAVFVVHAEESRLSINEENAGIGYARFYRALLSATGEYYKGGSVKNRFFVNINLPGLHNKPRQVIINRA